MAQLAMKPETRSLFSLRIKGSYGVPLFLNPFSFKVYFHIINIGGIDRFPCLGMVELE